MIPPDVDLLFIWIGAVLDGFSMGKRPKKNIRKSLESLYGGIFFKKGLKEGGK